MTGDKHTRIYNVDDCISFRKTTEGFGGLSNMAPGYKIRISNIEFLTSEALYQACRFPNHPEIQQEIINQHSPMYAKDISRKYTYLTRQNWDKERVKIMRWTLRMKLINNWYTFGELLKSTSGKVIVEDSAKDTFWGAQKIDNSFVGVNALGRLLMELREQYTKIDNKTLITVVPPKVESFNIMGNVIGSINIDVSNQLYGTNEKMW